MRKSCKKEQHGENICDVIAGCLYFVKVTLIGYVLYLIYKYIFRKAL